MQGLKVYGINVGAVGEFTAHLVRSLMLFVNVVPGIFEPCS